MMRRMLAPVEMAFDSGKVVLVKAEAYFSYTVTAWPLLRKAIAAESPPVWRETLSSSGNLRGSYLYLRLQRRP